MAVREAAGFDVVVLTWALRECSVKSRPHCVDR